MMWSWLFLVLVLCALTLWRGRRIPLSGWRKQAVIGCRLIAVLIVCATLLGASRRRVLDVPRYLIYLVDGSSSIDAAQREWMARRLASVDSLRPQGVEQALMVFGADAAAPLPFTQRPLDEPGRILSAIAQAPVDTAHTNLETALLSAAGLTPSRQPAGPVRSTPTGRGSIVLLSDGRETAGNVTGILAFVRRLGLSVFPVSPPTFSRVKTAWEELAVPAVVQRGEPVPLQLVLFNGEERVNTGTVSVALQGVVIKRQRVAVRPGWHVVSLSVPAIGLGTMALDVRLTIPAEGLDEHRPAYTEVEGPPQVLLVGDRLAALPALASALKRREIACAVARPADVPVDPEALLDYDAVLLFNVPKSAFSSDQAESLRTYLEQFGGGLVTVGLGGDLAQEITTPAPLDPLLPVTFEPKGLQESKRRVCMILLIDRSASMFGPRIAATKRASVELVKQLTPEDLVGILAFDTKPYVVAEVQPAGQVASSLVDKLVKLRSSGGTDIYPALAAAANRLELTGATVKHIILLSDGNTPIQEQAYRVLLESFTRTGTTVSTIGIGSAFVNTEYLQWLANATGGRFYPMRNLDELPQLVARDVQQEMGRLPFTEGRFRPDTAPTSDWFADIPEWPVLRGYLTTTAKPGAGVDVTVNGGEGDDPLLARWSIGRGRVVSFTSDADTRWSPEWIRWPAFEGVWAHVVRWAMRPRLAEELFVWLDDSGEEPQLLIEGVLQDPQGELIAADRHEMIPLPLVQIGTWRWRASLAQVPSGWYQLSLESRPTEISRSEISRDGTFAGPGGDRIPQVDVTGPQGSEGSAIFAKRWVQIGTPPGSEETVGQPPREALLRQIARATSGVYGEPDRALLPPTTTVNVQEPLLSWWLPVVIVLLLIEVALRGSSML